MALRLVERAVRVVQIYFGHQQPWDTHIVIMDQAKLAAPIDRPAAALLRDLEECGLLAERRSCSAAANSAALRWWRSGARSESRMDGITTPYGFTMWLAGGGIKGGMTYGATDEFGFKVAKDPVAVHALLGTILHLMWIDHERLTYNYSGRDFRLTDVGGQVIKEILAGRDSTSNVRPQDARGLNWAAAP